MLKHIYKSKYKSKSYMKSKSKNITVKVLLLS